MLSHVGLAWYPGAHKGAPVGDAPVKFWKDMMGFDYAPPWETPIHPSPQGLTRPRPPGGPLQTPQRQQCQAWWGVGVSGLRRAARSSGLHAGCDANGTLGKGRPGSEWLPRDGGVHRTHGPPSARALGTRPRTAPSEPGPSGARPPAAFLGFQVAVTSRTAMLPPLGPMGRGSVCRAAQGAGLVSRGRVVPVGEGGAC